MKVWWIRSLFFSFGMIILSLGVSMIIRSNVGTSSWDVLFVGLSDLIHITVGTSVFLVQVVIMFLNSILQKKRPDFLSLATVFVNGLCIDLFLNIILKDYVPSSIWQQYTIFATGLILLAFGVSLYLQAKFPSTPVDTLMLVIHSKLGLSYGLSRLTGESGALIIGLLIGGPVGWGTLLIAILFAPIIQVGMIISSRFYLKLTSLPAQNT